MVTRHNIAFALIDIPHNRLCDLLRSYRPRRSATPLPGAKRPQPFWTSPTTRQALLDRLPAYRLSKLQVLLPDRLSAEVVGQYLLDLQGTEEWLTARGNPSEAD